jgi:hypothetical protein
MKYIKLILLVLLLGSTISIANDSASIAEANIGTKIFRKKLRRICRSTGSRFAQSHTRKEWKAFYDTNNFRIEFHRLCPRKEFVLDNAWLKPLYEFTKLYAKDSHIFAE